ncbi:MAG: hypothetical protein ABSG57_07360 [Candidatus Bathyarchaeia archaeon]
MDAALTGVFCALWIFLNWILAPLSVTLLGGIPIFHDFAVFFTLLLVAWVTGRFGTSSLAGIVGSVIVVSLGGPPPIIMFCFAVSAVIFDLLMSASHHRIRSSAYSMIVASVATVLSAYVAGVLIGVLFTPNDGLQWALTIWGGWHFVGGIFTLTITLPLIAALEKANVRKILGEAQ